MSGHASYAAVVSFRRLRTLFFLTGATMGTFYPFQVLLLIDGGLDAVGIGAVMGASALVALFAYPAWGLLADGPLGRERSVAVAGVLAAAIGAFLLVVYHDPLLLGLGIALLPLGIAPWEPITDAIALQALGEGARAYGRFRLWTSVGWAATSLIGGVVYVLVGGGGLLLAFTAGSLVITAATARPRGGRSWRHVAVHRQPLIPELRRALVVAPVLVPVLAAVFLEWLGNAAVSGFLPLRDHRCRGRRDPHRHRGSGAGHRGDTAIPDHRLALGAARPARVYVLGLVVSVGVMLFVAVVQEPVLVALSRGLEGASYVLRYAGIVLIVGAVLPHALRATGQSLARLVGGGLAAIVAVRSGAPSTRPSVALPCSLSCAGLTGLGAVIAWRGLRGPAFGPGANRHRQTGRRPRPGAGRPVAVRSHTARMERRRSTAPIIRACCALGGRSSPSCSGRPRRAERTGRGIRRGRA